MLICPVRDCRLPLVRDDRRLVCPRSHSYDVARSGYVNLLQPQDRKSKHPGDSADAVAARRRLLDLGVARPLLQGIQEFADVLPSDVLLDAGCGEGYYPGSLAAETGCRACGADISSPAIDTAARRYPESEWIVANADRFIPYPDDTFSLLISITGRMNPDEFHRVLRSDGRMLVAIPAPDDLIELRGGESEQAGRDRVPRTVDTFAARFSLVKQSRVTTTADLSAEAVRDVLLAIYRPLGPPPEGARRVTFSLDLLLFRPLPAQIPGPNQSSGELPPV